MMTGAASSGRMIAVYQRPCSARMTALALLRASISAKSAARDLDRLRALRIGGGELGLIRVEEAVDDRRGEKLCEPLQHGGYPFSVLSSPRRRIGAKPKVVIVGRRALDDARDRAYDTASRACPTCGS